MRPARLCVRINSKEVTMNKALVVSAAVALALSGAALAETVHRGEVTHFTESDCNTLRVPSARADCMRSLNRDMREERHAVGATGGRAGGEGYVHVKNVKHKKYHRHHAHREVHTR
jgi:hypothetical protein